MPSSIDTSVVVKITLSNGKEITPFNSLTISQSIVQHHTFEVKCYHEVLESKNADIISETQNLVGLDITIIIHARKSGSPETVFKGLITEVGMVQGDGLNHEICLKGFSSTIKLENGPKLRAFLDQSVTDIARKVLNSSGMRFSIQSSNSPIMLKYCAQFNESDFQFVRRMAAIHGEWFYYDGSQLIFGEPGTLKTVKLQYMGDLMTLSTSMGTVPLKFSNFSYDSLEARLYKSPTSFSTQGTDSYGSKMFSTSKNIYPDNFNFMPRHVANTQAGLDNFSKSYFNSMVSDLVHVNASGDNPEASIGVLADITTEKGNSYGKFFITSIVHHADGMGHYSNSFSGIPSTLKSMPNPYFHKPSADFEIAKVVENGHEHGMVKVKFMWMNDEKTNWIPTTQLYGGEAGFKNRGTVFVPEINDEVMVGFERGDCDRPYVAFSLMNGKAVQIDSGDSKKNLKKIISTRDNNLVFHDKGDGNEPVGVKLNVYKGESKPKAMLHMIDDGQKTLLDMTAIDQLNIATNGKEVVILMKKDGSIKVTGKNINIEAEETLTLKGKDIKMEAMNEIHGKANKNITFEAMANIELKATANFTAKANAKVSIEGSAQAELKSAMISVKANAMMELDGGGMASLKGGIVMIN